MPPAAAEVFASSRSDEDTSIEGSDILETEPWDLMGAFARAEPGLSLGKLVQVHVSVRSSSLVVYLKETTLCCMLEAPTHPHPTKKFKKKVWVNEKECILRH